MKILTGLQRGMVMPVDRSGKSAQQLTGICRHRGTISFTAIDADGREAAAGEAGQAAGGKFTAVLAGIPAGGPYRITLKAGREKLTVSEVYTGELWLLAGQSNMQGRGRITGTKVNTDPRIRAFYMDGVWDTAGDPVCSPEYSPAPAHLRLLMQPEPLKRPRLHPAGTIGAGPGVPFAIAREKRTGVPVGLINCSHGGTSIEQWEPGPADNETLYGTMLGKVRRNGGRVTGMLWYQGCNNTADAKSGSDFEEKTLNFFRSVRRALKTPDLPIVQAQLCRTITSEEAIQTGWTVIREVQRLMPKKLSGLLTVPTLDLTLEDNVHLTEESYFTLGARMEEAAAVLTGDRSAVPPIELVKVRSRREPGIRLNVIELTFRNVIGKLVCNSRPLGFAADASGKDLFSRVELHGNKVKLYCSQVIRRAGYGLGTNPPANVTDAAGRPLPAFACQSVLTKDKMIFSEISRKMELTELIPGSENLEPVTAEMCRGLKFSPAENRPSYNLFPDQKAMHGKRGIRFFRCRYRAKKEMDIAFSLGYDGRVKFFDNGEVFFADNHGAPPLIPGSKTIKRHWLPGDHEIVAAINAGDGNVWGISLALMCHWKDREFLPEEI